MAVMPRRPILSHRHTYWLRDIMRDCECSRAEREAMERHNDGERLIEAAAAMGCPCGSLRAWLARCRGKAERQRLDVDEVLEAAAVTFAAAMRHQGAGGGNSDGEERPMRPEAALVLEEWTAWVWDVEWL